MNELEKEKRREYLKEYRKQPEVIAKAKEYHRVYREAHRDEVNKRNREHKKTEKGRATRNKGRKAWTLREKQKCLDYKGGKCIVCGYDKCPACLDFHHLDPTTKKLKGAGAIVSHWTFEKNIDELDKCVILCCRCHRELHNNFITLDLQKNESAN